MTTKPQKCAPTNSQLRLEARRLNWERYKTGPSGKHTHARPGSQKK